MCVSISLFSFSTESVSIPVCLFFEERFPFFFGFAASVVTVSIGSVTSGYLDSRNGSETDIPRISGTSCGVSQVTRGVVPGV